MEFTRRQVGAAAVGALAAPLPVLMTHGTAQAAAYTITVKPSEYPGALKNPLMGMSEKDFLVNTTDPACPEDQPLDYMPWASLVMTYIPWDHLEDDEDDGLEKISAYLDQRWRGKDAAGVWRPYEEYNIKVIPRVYLRFPAETSGNASSFYGLGGDHWPADLRAGDFTSSAFDARLRRMIQRLAQLWDDDPRVAFIQMGIFGTWGEQHGTAQPANIETYFQQYFTKKHVQVRYVDKNQWAHPELFGHYNDSIGNLNTAGNWATQPVGGEPSYDYVGEKVHGTLVRQTYLDDDYTNNTVNLVRFTHSAYLTWVGDYSYGSRWTAADAQGGREAYLANKAKIDANAEKLQRELGYRFVISEFTYPQKILRGQSFEVSFKVRNTGSAPMYYNWPIQIRLYDPVTGQTAWSDTFKNVDITQWQPGSGYPAFNGKKDGNWSESVLAYTTAAQQHQITGTFTVPATVRKKTYEVQLAVLDPAGNVPSLRFAIRNYRAGGYHPMGYAGVQQFAETIEIDPDTFDNPAVDVGLRYYLPGETLPTGPAILSSLTVSGATLRLAEGGGGFDLENLLLQGTDSQNRVHGLDAATVTWKVSSGTATAALVGSTLKPLGPGAGTVTAMLNGVISDPYPFEVSDDIGGITGTVRDEQGQGIVGASVSITTTSEPDAMAYLATTESDGSFSLNGLFAGTYTVEVRRAAYETGVLTGIQVTKGNTTRADVTLELTTAGNFSDDFSLGAANWTPGAGAWAVTGGQYMQSTVGGSNSWRYMSTITGKVWADATYDVDITYAGPGENWAGMLFRKPAQGDTINTAGYFVAWHYSGRIELNRSGSKIVNLATVQRATDWTGPHHLRIVNRGNNIKVYVDGEPTPIITLDDDTYAHGYAGVGAHGSKWSFDNVQVTE